MLRRRWVLLAVVILVLLTIGGGLKWIDGRGRPEPMRVSRETTYITKPLNQDGTVNYVAYVDAIAREGVTSENNAAIKYLQAVGPQGLKGGPASVQQILRQLDLTLPADGKYFVALDPLIRQWAKETGMSNLKADEELDKQFDAARENLWSATELPLLDQWITDNGAPLDLLVEASKMSRFYVPPASGSNPPSLGDAYTRLNMSITSGTLKCLTARATRSLSAGDWDAAWKDVYALYRLSRLLQGGSERPPIRELVGKVGEERAADVVSLMAQQESLNASRARAILKDLLDLPDLPPTTKTDIEDARLFALDLCQETARKGYAGFDCNYAMISQNERADAQLAALEIPDYAAVERALKRPGEDIERDLKYWTDHKGLFVLKRFFSSRRINDQTTTDLVMAGIFPNCSRWYTYEVNCRTRAELAKAALALVTYRAENGRFPESLDALTPTYLPKAPRDSYMGKPLAYRREPDGSCIVYSFGQNLKDDGGNVAKDLAVRLGTKVVK